MAKLFCFDVDDTLREKHTNKVSQSTKDALKKLKEAGHYIVINTGRSFASLKKTGVCECADWDGYIINNGQMLLDDQEQIIESYSLNVDAVKEAIRVAESLGQPVNLKMDHRIMTKEPNDYVYSTQRYFNNDIPEVGVYDEHLPVYAMILYGPKGYDYAPYKAIEGLYVAPGRDCYADATIDGITKGTGGMTFAKRFDLDGYIAFGDSQNDLEMFKMADFTICMGDGEEMTKQIADYVTTGINEDGIYRACEQLGYFLEDE